MAHEPTQPSDPAGEPVPAAAVPGPASGSGEVAGSGTAPGQASGSGPEEGAGGAALPDPLKGFRGVVAATLVLEVIVVLLTLLVVGKFGGNNGGPLGVTVVLVLAAVMVVLARYAGRPWAATAALAVQLVMLACGLLVGVLAALGVIFGLTWFALLMMRRDVAGRMARGELPSQRLG
ncbi:MAG TPA: DUF4233 domain-containing protein [Pseudonocardia sp.]